LLARTPKAHDINLETCIAECLSLSTWAVVNRIVAVADDTNTASGFSREHYRPTELLRDITIVKSVFSLFRLDQTIQNPERQVVLPDRVATRSASQLP
jgi:hypothetical protein